MTIKTQLIQSGFQGIVVTRSYAFCESLYISWQIHQRRRTVNTKLRNTVSAADTEAQYDEKTKQLRSNKIILAHILVKTVDEFHGMNPKDVVSYIEGDSFISVVPVEPVSRLVSSQKERDFVKTNYNDIRRVFSIWACMAMDENSLDYVHLTDDKLLGSYSWKGRLDLLNIVLIGISNELPEHVGKYELHRLLSTLLSMELAVDEKLSIMENEYNIPVDDRIRKNGNAMCNLSQGILERGEARGEAIGKAKEGAKFIFNMYEKGYTLEQIADVAEKALKKSKPLLRKRSLY